MKDNTGQRYDLPWSRVTMGTATFGSRVERRDALRALDIGFDHGVKVIDTARAYGYGESESIVGQFLKGRRDQVSVVTKFGISARTPARWLHHFKRPARALLQMAPALFRKGVPRFVGSQATGEFAPESIESSVQESLRQLDVDTIDVLFFHGATPSTLQSDEVWLTLEKMKQKGYFRYLGLSGTLGLEEEAESRWSHPYCVQYSIVDLFGRAIREQQSGVTSQYPGLLTKGRFGFHPLMPLSPEQKESAASSLSKGGCDIPLRRVLLSAPFIEGIVDSLLLSSSNPAHIIDNIQVVNDALEPEVNAAWSIIRPQITTAIDVPKHTREA